MLGAGNYKFKPGYWTGWSRKQGSPKETVVRLVVESEGLERIICSAVLDAEMFPYLATTPFWLRGIFAALRLLPRARRWLVRMVCYVGLQVIYREHGHWECKVALMRWDGGSGRIILMSDDIRLGRCRCSIGAKNYFQDLCKASTIG